MKVAYAIQCIETGEFYDPWSIWDDPKMEPFLTLDKDYLNLQTIRLNAYQDRLLNCGDIDQRQTFKIVAVQYSIQEIP